MTADLPPAALDEAERRMADLRVWCPARNRWLRLDTEADCPDHAGNIERERAVVLKDVRKGRWDHERQRYVPWNA